MSGAIALEPTPTTATFRHEETAGDEESAPLIVEDAAEEPLDSVLDPEIVRPEGRMGDNIAQIVAYVSSKDSSGRNVAHIAIRERRLLG